MTTVERTFRINEDIAKALDNMVALEAQSSYINELLSKNMQGQNADKLNDMIINFRSKYPKNEGMSSTDLLRKIRDGELR